LAQVLSLAMPFFGLIFLGYIGGKIVRAPQEGLVWLNTFILYFALPALFFRLISRTPFQELAQWSFVLTTTFTTYCVFTIAFVIGYLVSRGDVRVAGIQAALGSYSNIGYMGPGITIAALGPAATVPTALIFCFDSILIFTLVPLMMALGRHDHVSMLAMAGGIARRILLHPFILATAAGVVAAYLEFRPPVVIDSILEHLAAAAAPCALFALGVMVALRPVKRVAWELPFLMLLKLVVHPALVLVALSLMGTFDPVWVYTAVLMAALPPALNVFILAQQNEVYVERASSGILIGTVISVVTLTAALYLVANGLLPTDLFP
jgi:malonate transporter and related proteins